MKNPLLFLLLFIGVSLSFSSCKSAAHAEKFAKAFFKAVIAQNIDEAMSFVDIDGGDVNTMREDLINFAQNDTDGKLLEANKGIGFSTNISNGVTTVELPYTLIYENVEYNRQVILIDRGEGFKVSSIE